MTGSTFSRPFAAPKPRAIDSLTGIRGAAALWVFLTHYQALMAAYLNSPEIAANTFLYNGFRGVDLFFVLSGFILMHVHGEDFHTINQDKLWRFYVLRFFRVYPLNAFVLIAMLPIYFYMPDLVEWFRTDHGIPIPWHSHDFSEAGFVQTLFLAQTWTFIKPGEWNGPAWSLSAEVFGYALFPLLAWFFIRCRSALFCAGFAFLSLGLLMVLLVIFHHTQDSPTGTFGLIRMLFGFIAGMAMARCFHLLPADSQIGGPIAIASLGFIAAALSVHVANVLIVFGFCGLIFGLAFQQGPVNTLMSSGPAMFLGRISFSLYMIHYVPLKISLWLLQTRFAESSLTFRIFCLIATAVICLALAILTHRYLELRFQRYARVLLRGPHAPSIQIRSA